MSVLGIAIWTECPEKLHHKPASINPRTGECSYCDGSGRVLKNLAVPEFVDMLAEALEKRSTPR